MYNVCIYIYILYFYSHMMYRCRLYRFHVIVKSPITNMYIYVLNDLNATCLTSDIEKENTFIIFIISWHPCMYIFTTSSYDLHILHIWNIIYWHEENFRSLYHKLLLPFSVPCYSACKVVQSCRDDIEWHFYNPVDKQIIQRRTAWIIQCRLSSRTVQGQKVIPRGAWKCNFPPL